MSDWTLNGGEGYGRHWIDIADEMERQEPVSTVLQSEIAMATGDLSDRLCTAERPDESVDAVLEVASRLFDNCVLFRVRKNLATIWAARGQAPANHLLAAFAESSVSGNPLELLMIHSNYRGLAPVEQAYVPFFDRLGLPYPAEISLSPIEVNGRLVGILYGDCGETGRLRSTEEQDLALARRLTLGFALVLIKKKIRALGDA